MSLYEGLWDDEDGKDGAKKEKEKTAKLPMMPAHLLAKKRAPAHPSPAKVPPAVARKRAPHPPGAGSAGAKKKEKIVTVTLPPASADSGSSVPSGGNAVVQVSGLFCAASSLCFFLLFLFVFFFPESVRSGSPQCVSRSD